MANAFTTVTQLTFFGREVLKRLRKRLGFAGRVNRDYQGAAEAPGNRVRVPYVSLAGGYTIRTTGGAVTADDASSGYIDVGMQQIVKAFKIDNLDATMASVALFEETAEQASQILAEAVDAILWDLWPLIPYQVGTLDGTSAFATALKLTKLSAAKGVLRRNLADLSNVWGVLGSVEEENILNLDTTLKVNEAGTDSALRDGRIGRLLGVNMDVSNTIANVTLTTAAAWGAPAINHGGGYAIGDTVIALDALGAGTIKAGSIVKIGAYFYTVAADVVIAGNAATITLNQPLKTAPADNELLTPTSHSAAGSMNLVFNPRAFMLVTRPEHPFPAGAGVLEIPVSDPDSGLSMRMMVEAQAQGGAGDAMSTKGTFSLLAGSNIIRDVFAVRLSGGAEP